MRTRRRDFLRFAGLAGLGVTGLPLPASFSNPFQDSLLNTPAMASDLNNAADNDISLIGNYGKWAASLHADRLPSLSFRQREWTDLERWRETAQQRFRERLAIPAIASRPEVTVEKSFRYDGLHIEFITWQLSYGNPTKAVLLKPSNATGPLPGILAFHDHGGNKYFGLEKITSTGNDQHPQMGY